MVEIEPFIETVQHAANEFTSSSPGRVVLFHHNDTDGLTSGFIIKKAVERLGWALSSYCLEKPYPEALETIFSDFSGNEVVVIADFGSGMLGEISRVNKGNQPVYLLDHHSLAEGGDSSITIVNPLVFDIPGHKECSASAVCYLFAKAISPFNLDLASFGVLGAIGDSMYDASGELTGMNAHVLKDVDTAVTFENGEYHYKEYGLTGKELKQSIDSLGSFGYQRGGPDLALKGFEDGFSWQYTDQAAEFARDFDKDLERWEGKDSIQSRGELSWFALDDRFLQYGVKSVGLACERFLESGKVGVNQYLVGFQTIPELVPGLGRISFNKVKVSMRLGASLLERMNAGEAKPLTDILVPATESLGGFVDACHKHAAATVIDCGQEDALIEAIERLL